jgi:hypothetical protein
MSRKHHPNSTASAASIDFTQRQNDIIACSTTQNRPMTDREIFTTLGLFEKNSASPCITKLIDAGVMYEFDNVICPTTRKVVRRVALRPKPWKPLFGVVIQARVTALLPLVNKAQLEQLAAQLGEDLAKLEPFHGIEVTIREIDGHKSGKSEPVYSKATPPTPPPPPTKL